MPYRYNPYTRKLDYYKSSFVEATSQDLALYVNPQGNDLTGRGTLDRPYATIEKALSVIPREIKHLVHIRIAAGTYNSFPASICHDFFEDGKLIIDGTGADYTTIAAGPFTISAITDRGDRQGSAIMSEYTVSGQSWSTDQYQDKYIHFLTGAAAGVLYPIRVNDADTLHSFGNWHSIVTSDTFEIVEPSVVIDIDHPVYFMGNGKVGVVGIGDTSPCNAHFALGGLKFIIPSPNTMYFWALNVLTTFVSIIRTVGDGTVVVTDSNLNYDFASNFPKFDNAGSQTLVDIFFGRSLVLGTDYASPGDDHRQLYVQGANIAGICGAYNCIVWSGDSILFRILIGGVECYNNCKLGLFSVYCSIAGYRALNLLRAAIEMDGVYIGATTYLDFSQGITGTIDNFTGDSSSIANDYAVDMSRFAKLWLPNPDNVTIAGQVGAYRFINGNQETHVGWPAASNNETDNAGSYVMA